MEIRDYLLDLITTEELVSIPSLGGFISKHVSARLDPATHLFTPPHKQIAFNERLTGDSEKLLAHIQIKENCSLSEASDKVSAFVSDVKETLNLKKEYFIKGLGSFYSTDEGNIGFSPSIGSEIDPSNFGLPQILIKATELEQSTKFLRKPKDRKAMSTIDLQSVPDPGSPGDNPSRKNVEQNSKEPKEGNSLLWLYIITPVILLGGMGMFLGGTEDGRKVLANMHIISKPAEKDTVFSEDATAEATEGEGNTESFDNAESADETIKKTDNGWGEVPSKSKQEEIARTEDPALATANIIHGKSGRCFIIVGGFAKKKNAVRLREKLVQDGVESKILAPTESGGLFRVTLGDYPDLASAIKKAEDLKSTYGDNIWVKVY